MSKRPKFLIEVKRCTRLEHVRNTEIREELVVYSMQSKINQNQNNWYQYAERIDEDRLLKLATSYKQNGRKSIGRPRKR